MHIWYTTPITEESNKTMASCERITSTALYKRQLQCRLVGKSSHYSKATVILQQCRVLLQSYKTLAFLQEHPVPGREGWQ